MKKKASNKKRKPNKLKPTYGKLHTVRADKEGVRTTRDKLLEDPEHTDLLPLEDLDEKLPR